ncbi:MAG: hypothetical protein GQ557_02565 [Mycoplasmataceae bacterium]|nr:hypothetical protein [Mycoplasmataceae bacterium]
MGKRTKRQIVKSDTESQSDYESDYESDIDPKIFQNFKEQEENPFQSCLAWSELPKNSVIKIKIIPELIMGKFGSFYKIKFGDQIYYGHKNLEFRIKQQGIDINKTIFLKISKKRMENKGNLYFPWMITQ